MFLKDDELLLRLLKYDMLLPLRMRNTWPPSDCSAVTAVLSSALLTPLLSEPKLSFVTMGYSLGLGIKLACDLVVALDSGGLF